jgi:translation elongation factor EF-G
MFSYVSTLRGMTKGRAQYSMVLERWVQAAAAGPAAAAAATWCLEDAWLTKHAAD